MQIRGWLLRILRGAALALVAWLAFRWLDPKGLGLLVPATAALGALGWIAYRYRVLRRRQRAAAASERWAEALLDPPVRPQVIAELRAALARLRPSAARDAVERARLSLVLAELLEAEGQPDAALEVLRAVPDAHLPARTRATLAHARAVASLSAGDAEAATRELTVIALPTGDRELDLRVRAVGGLAAIERGEAERALELAEELRVEAGSDADLRLEARVLKAAALDALGEREDALSVMKALGEEMLGVLLVLGLPRVKRLADEALDGVDP
jgi:tetratricopeptide (TPR) repeat protein